MDGCYAYYAECELFCYVLFFLAVFLSCSLPCLHFLHLRLSFLLLTMLLLFMLLFLLTLAPFGYFTISYDTSWGEGGTVSTFDSLPLLLCMHTIVEDLMITRDYLLGGCFDFE